MTIEAQAPILMQLLAVAENPAISWEGRCNAWRDIAHHYAWQLHYDTQNVSQGFMRYPPMKPCAAPKRQVEAVTIPGEMQAP